MLGLLIVGILIAGGSPGYAQRAGPRSNLRRSPDLNGIGPEVVPIETRAWAHDDFGRIVFDWPWAVAYGARIEGTTLTVMFDRRLHTIFRQVPRHLGAYITAIDLGPDGQSVVASLTNEYRLRTFLLTGEGGGVKVVVDLLADGEAGPVLAQAPTPPSLEPSPAAVPGDALSLPTSLRGLSLPISRDRSPKRHLRNFLLASLSQLEADSTPESRENLPRPLDQPRTTPPERGSGRTCPSCESRCRRQRRGGSDLTPASAQTAEAPDLRPRNRQPNRAQLWNRWFLHC